MKTDNYTDHVSKKTKRQISEIRLLALKKTAQNYPFKLTTRFQLSGAYTAAQSQQRCELLPKATDKYHQEGQKHDGLPGNLQLRKSGRSCCQCRGGGRSEAFQRASHRPGARRGGEAGRFNSLYSCPRSREATRDRKNLSKEAAEPLFFRLEAGHLPSYVAGYPLTSLALLPGALPIPIAPHRCCPVRSRPLRGASRDTALPPGPAPPPDTSAGRGPPLTSR